jgi:hypothetical protein
MEHTEWRRERRSREIKDEEKDAALPSSRPEDDRDTSNAKRRKRDRKHRRRRNDSGVEGLERDHSRQKKDDGGGITDEDKRKERNRDHHGQKRHDAEGSMQEKEDITQTKNGIIPNRSNMKATKNSRNMGRRQR